MVVFSSLEDDSGIFSTCPMERLSVVRLLVDLRSSIVVPNFLAML